MRAAKILVLAFTVNVFASDAQKVLGSADILGGNKYECKNGAKPSIICDDASKKHNCSCTCTNGITFEQPLDPFASPASGVADDTCEAEKIRNMEREQQLLSEKAELEKDKQGLAADVAELNKQLGVYQDKPKYTRLGCMTDNTASRVLANSKTSNVMTVKLCDSFCKQYKFFGVQWTNECWCDHTFKQPTKHVDDKECSKPCAGDSTQICGGSSRNTVYMRTE